MRPRRAASARAFASRSGVDAHDCDRPRVRGWAVIAPAGFRALAADVRGLPRAAWVIYAGTFVNRFGSFVLTFLVLVLTRRGFSPAQAGLAAAAYGVGSLGAGIVGGQLADRIGRRGTIVLSMFSSAAVLV